MLPRPILLSPLLTTGAVLGASSPPPAKDGADAAAVAASGALALPDLSAHRWAHRVMVIDTPSPGAEPYRTQMEALTREWPGLLERDLHVVTRAGAGVTVFRIRLVGKDGLTKLDSTAPVTTAALFDLVDAMPMRRAEAAARPARPATD
jgi:hypothetical protein